MTVACSDPEGASPAVRLVAPPAQGTVTALSGQTISWTPPGGFDNTTVDCHDPDGGPATLSVVRQAAYGTTTIAGSTVNDHGTFRWGIGTVGLRTTDDEGDTTGCGGSRTCAPDL